MGLYMRKVDRFRNFLEEKSEIKIKIMLKKIKGYKGPIGFKYFIDRIENNEKYKKIWKSTLNNDLIEVMVMYLNIYNGKDVYLLIYSYCKDDEKKLFLITSILNSKKNIEISPYFNDMKNHVKLLNSKIYSSNEKGRLINEINNKRKNLRKNDNNIIFIPHCRTILYSNKIFMDNLDQILEGYKDYPKNSEGLILALNHFYDFFDSPLDFDEVKKEFLKGILKDNKDIINYENAKSDMSYGDNFSQEVSFKQLVLHRVLMYKLAQNMIDKEKIEKILDYKNDLYIFPIMHQCIIEKMYKKLKSYKITEMELELFSDCIYGYLCGIHKTIFGIIPILESIYKKVYNFKDDKSNEFLITENLELYNNEMIRNIFLKSSHLKSNEDEAIYYCLNIKNDFFHYKFVDHEIMEYMAVYVFNFVIKEFVIDN